MHLFDHSFLVKRFDDHVEVCLFDNGAVSSEATPDHCYFQTAAGWVDEHGERPDPDMLADLDAVLLPVEGNNVPLYGENPTPGDGQIEPVVAQPVGLLTGDFDHDHFADGHTH